MNDYRMQLGLPVLEADDANAPHGALPWHKSDEHTDIGAVLHRNVPTDQAQILSYCRMHMLGLCPSPESDRPASKPRKAYHCIALDRSTSSAGVLMLPCALLFFKISASVLISTATAGQAHSSAS